MKNERGFVLIAVLALLAVIGTVAAIRFIKNPVNDFEQQSINDERSINQAYLEEARLRLIASAIQQNSNPGALPCPDRTNQGWESSCNADQARQAQRFPYGDAGVPMLPMPTSGGKLPVKDNAGECAWYALSPSFRKSNVPVGSRSLSKPDMQPLNPDNYGSLKLNNQTVIAVLIAAGNPIRDQSYAQSGGSLNQNERALNTPCNTGLPTAFIEPLGVPNSTSTAGVFADSATPTAIDKSSNLCTSRASILEPENIGAACNNDVVVAIKRDDLMKPLIREVLTRLVAQQVQNSSGEELIPSATPGLVVLLAGKPASSLKKIRDAGPHAFDTLVFGSYIKGEGVPEANGCFRSSGSNASYDPRPLWLCANDWYSFIEHDGANTLSISLDRARSNSFKCSTNLTDATRKVVCS